MAVIEFNLTTILAFLFLFLFFLCNSSSPCLRCSCDAFCDFCWLSDPSTRRWLKQRRQSFTMPLSAITTAILSLAATVAARPPLSGDAINSSKRPSSCPSYASYSQLRHEPLSPGRYHIPYQRPPPECRTFISPAVEAAIEKTVGLIADPDLAWLFENTFPNTLDTAISWQGHANGSGEELAFVVTGDISAMWLRDSANQLQPYAALLAPSADDNLAGLFRGAINTHARYLLIDPYCNAFQPPVESGISPVMNMVDRVTPAYDFNLVYQCSYQLDSLAAFLQLSVDYFSATKDADFFARHDWVAAVKVVMATAFGMVGPTYADDGKVKDFPYTFFYCSNTLQNGGYGSPVSGGTGLLRSTFRPSDDPTIFQFFIPANMMFASYLGRAAEIMSYLDSTLASEMESLSKGLREAIEEHGIVHHKKWGRIYAYEVDGYGSMNIMDDANTPSLLSAPLSGYLDASNEVYQNTRRMILGMGNPYWSQGPLISSVGGPHVGLGKGWPMASIVRIMTSDNDTEITQSLHEILRSTAGLGLIHESVDAWDQFKWSRQWFAWANGLFGQMILDLSVRKPDILQQSFQGDYLDPKPGGDQKAMTGDK